ncbi:hypothetical protein LPJ53_003235 [Coemansia erecta]|uniref:Ribosomal protein 60S n=1 Tax=Coemansia erecta TaxID=147472 RepID=A0A9W7Y2I0_9FUNG|nr:hypothetical protein LPJ53_003235 [Coemansia erecta]
MSVAEKAIVYAALILADDNVAITLEAITKAAGVEVESIYFNLFAKAFEGKDLNELLLNVGSSAGAAAPAATAGGAAVEEAKAEEKVEEEEESDEDMGFGLFD